MSSAHFAPPWWAIAAAIGCVRGGPRPVARRLELADARRAAAGTTAAIVSAVSP